VVFLLAREMYMRTNGAYRLDDLMAVLYQKYKNLNGRCDEPCLQVEIEAITGSDFTQFFNDYIYGTAPLPMQWAFEDDDGDGLSNIVEIYFDTHPSKSDTDGDGFSDLNDNFPNDPQEWLDTDNDGIGNNTDWDDDNDSMQDGWEIVHGLNPLVNDANLDKDGDGFTNLREYRAGSKPNDPNSIPKTATSLPFIPLLLE